MKIRTIVIVLITVVAAYGILNAFAGLLLTQNSLQANGNLVPLSPSLWYGDTENYQLYFSYQHPINSTQAWLNLLTRISSSPTDYRDNLHWKVFKLAFTFSNLNSTNLTFTNFSFTAMDSIVNVLASHGYQVIFVDSDYSGFGSHTWIQDWMNVTQHYKGDIRILAFGLFGEPVSTSWAKNVTTVLYNSTESVQSAYSNATARIHQIDPSR